MEEIDFMKITVVGAGVLGGYYGALMARAGYDVHFYIRSGVEEVRKKGWVVESIQGNFTENVQVYDDLVEIGESDVIILAAKTTVNHSLIKQLHPLVNKKVFL